MNERECAEHDGHLGKRSQSREKTDSEQRASDNVDIGNDGGEGTQPIGRDAGCNLRGVGEIEDSFDDESNTEVNPNQIEQMMPVCLDPGCEAIPGHNFLGF